RPLQLRLAAPASAAPRGGQRVAPPPPGDARLVPRHRPGTAACSWPQPGIPQTAREHRVSVSLGTDARTLEGERMVSAPLVERRARSIAAPRNRVGWLVLGGRVLLIWLPVYVLLASSLRPFQAVLATCVVTAIWTIGLRAALSTYFTLGPAVASAAGTIMGLVAISALDLWVSDLELGTARLAEAAIAVFVLSAAW